MKTTGKLSVFWSEPVLRSLQFATGVVAVSFVFWFLQFSTSAICCGDFDGYYHIQWSRELWESFKNGRLLPDFPWLPLTTLNPKDYVDHHFLFHIIQIPFAQFEDPRFGAKVASAVFASLAVISCYWLLIRYRIRYPLMWLVALIGCSSPFLFRMNMAKAPPFAILYLIIGIHLFFKRKYWPLLLLATIFTWTYDMFVLLLLAAVLWVAVVAWTEHRFEWRPLLWVAGGTVVGMVLNPYFPQNLQLLYEHLSIKLTPVDFDVKVGSEWYPYSSWEFIGNSFLACVAMFVGYICFDLGDRKRAHFPLFFLLFSTALMIMTARWKRIAEYWPPFAILFAAFSVQPWLEGTRSALTRLPEDILAELQPFFDRELGFRVGQMKIADWVKVIIVSTITLMLAAGAFVNVRATRREIRTSEAHPYYERGAAWLRDNVPPGEIIFNTDWDDFPRLFYFDPSHYYVSGLDPSYLFDKNPELSRIYERITLGHEENPGPLIRDRFGARYVFTDNNHHDFTSFAQESGRFEIVYEDEDCMILRILEEQPAAPEPGLPLGPDPMEIPN